ALAAAVVTLPGRSGIGAAGGAVMLAALVAGLTVAWMLLRDVHRGGASRIGRMLRAVAGEGSGDGWRRRLIGWWEELVRALSGSVIGSGAWWPSLALSAVIFLAVVAVQMIAFVAIGSDVGFVQAVFAVAGAGFIQVMAASPGGTVVTEASLIGVFKAMGVDPEAAVVAVLLARFVNYLVLLPWGGVAFLRLQRRYGMPRETGGAVPA
ncbi:MAG TPA: lysylphosphatidylglycerol synthase domain-containing protein, partial [Candidatus Polarisedimenticolia bacterium]|nr:lysylphosphatidylglycerol synthase domain-containing protein [Candidatus Polarisedimenticolia bacterium]